MPNTPPETGQPVDLADAPQHWTVHEVEDVWSGPAPFSVHRDQVSAPGRPDEPFGRLVLQHPGAVVVFALDDEERELPAGLLDVAGEDPLEAAKRELQEEGLVMADRWSHLLTTVPSPGLSSERIETYLAEGLHPAVDRGGFEPEHEEADMTVSWVPVRDLLDGVLAGRLTNGPLALAVMAYRLR